MELNINNHMCARPLERVGGFSSNLQGYWIGTTFRADCLGDLDLIFKVTVGLTMTSLAKLSLYAQYIRNICLDSNQTCTDT